MKKISILLLALSITGALTACGEPKTLTSVTIQTATASDMSNTPLPVPSTSPTQTASAQTTIAPSNNSSPSANPTDTATNTPKTSSRASGTLPSELVFSDTIITDTSSIDENNTFTTILTSTTDKNLLITAYQKTLNNLNIENFSEATQGDNWGFIGELDGQSISGIIAPDTTDPKTTIIEITLQES